jgi:hypothetical protein
VENERKIFKFKIEIEDSPTCLRCEGYYVEKILSVGLDPAGDVCCWAIVRELPELPMSMAGMVKGVRKSSPAVLVVGTGQPFSFGDHIFLGTVTQGSYVWHLFECA